MDGSSAAFSHRCCVGSGILFLQGCTCHRMEGLCDVCILCVCACVCVCVCVCARVCIHACEREREKMSHSLPFLPLLYQLTPAESRELNKECTLLGFYDNHDIWHFLSAVGMFFSFLVSLVI